MRLHRLELSAFGPFAGRVEVDLDALATDGLFLLHGETGAGKTTLLDAVAFALYGRVPGARGEAKRLRCDRAEPATPTRVTLELSIGGRRMVITRNPEYQRPKTRGAGTTTQKAAVTLRWVDAPPDGLPPANLTRAEEVGQLVLDLLGMSAEQFFQVVLLPQGEFARFLRADTADREVLLEKLFDTGRFAAIEGWFAEARRAARAAADEASGVVAQELARVLEAAGLPAVGHAAEPAAGEAAGARVAGQAPADSEPAEPEVDRAQPSVDLARPTHGPGADPAWLAELQADLRRRAEVAAATAETARAAREVAAADLTTGERRDAAVARLLELRADQAAVDAGAEANQAMQERLAAAERASLVVAAQRAVGVAEQAHSRAQQALSTAARAVPGDFHPDLGVAGTHEMDLDDGLFSLEEDGSAHVPDADAVVLGRAADLVRDEAGSLGALLGLAGEQDRDTAEHHRIGIQLTSADRERDDVETALARGPEERAAAEQNLQDIRQRAGRLADCDVAVVAATSVRDAAATLLTLQQRSTDAEAAYAAAVDAHQRARDERQALVERRIAGMAAELAGQLVDGTPCAVCGSRSHPGPAVARIGQVDQAAVAKAQRREQERESARAQAMTALTDLQQAVAATTAAACGHDMAAAQRMLDQAVEEQRAAGQATALLPAAVAALDEIAGRLAELAERRTSLMGTVQGFRTVLDRLELTLAKRAERLAEAAGGFASVAARRDHLLAIAEKLDAWASAADQADRARAVLSTALQERDKAVADAGFTSLEAALAAADLDVPRCREAVHRYQERRLVIVTQLEHPDLQLDGQLERIDIGTLRQRTATTAADAERATSEAHAAGQRCDQVAAAAERLQGAWAAHAPLAEQSARMTALAEVIAGRGQNSRALSLRSYVLAAKLQQVAEVAGERLGRMSGGRYSFVHTDEKEARGKSGGLGLDILDAYSGLVRPAKTLSGGESFLASLALALGLADVVAAESGGRLLDTIFIDEGFGSLDSDALELVMSTLDELRAGGRVVGVVSHVDEMRQRIPMRLRVRKGVAGSTVEVTAG